MIEEHLPAAARSLAGNLRDAEIIRRYVATQRGRYQDLDESEVSWLNPLERWADRVDQVCSHSMPPEDPKRGDLGCPG